VEYLGGFGYDKDEYSFVWDEHATFRVSVCPIRDVSGKQTGFPTKLCVCSHCRYTISNILQILVSLCGDSDKMHSPWKKERVSFVQTNVMRCWMF